MGQTTRRRGFTLIELLATIFIIGLLVALLLPAVQSAREAARRATCASQLKNVGIAIHNFADSNNAFPRGAGQPPLVASFLIQILPYIEQSALYNSINVSGASGYSDPNYTVSVSMPGNFICPSDASRSTIETRNSTNYAANAGRTYMTGSSAVVSGDGVFISKPISARQISDGLSQTVGVSEWVVGSGVTGSFPRLGYPYRLQQVYSYSPVDYTAFASDCESLNPRTSRQSLFVNGQFWLDSAMTYTLYNHTVPPNQPSCTAGLNMEAATASSLHPAGAHVVTMDGSVHFVKETIDPRIWLAIGTRSGGEAVDGSPY